MAALTSIESVDAEHFYANFSAAVDNVDFAKNWKLEVVAPATGMPSSVVKAERSANGALVTLTVSPGLSKGIQYRFTALNATAAGVPLANLDKQATITISAAAKAAFDLPHAVFAALVQTAAEETAYLSGRPQTLLVDEWHTDWDVVPVESTLGFPAAGRFWLDGNKYAYTSKTASTFRGVSPIRVVPDSSVSPKALVTLDLSSVE